MTIADLTQPDPVTLTKEYLEDQAEVTALVSTRILSRTGDPLPTRPFVRLDLAGGTMPEKRRLARWRIQVHVIGDAESEVACLAAARTLMAALTDASNYIGTAGVITGCDIESLPVMTHDDSASPALVDVTFAAAVYATNG